MKRIQLKSSAGIHEFDLNHAQRILQYQAAHPHIKDCWRIVGDKYVFDTTTNELIGAKNRSTNQKPKASEGVTGE